MAHVDKDKEAERKPEFAPPGLHQKPVFGQGKAKLVHPRKVLWSWMLGHLASYKWRYAMFGAFLLTGSIIMSFSPIISKTMIDAGIIPANMGVLLTLALLYLALMMGVGLLNFVGTYSMQKIGQNIIFNVRNELIGKIQGMSMNYFDKHLSGDIISIATNDVDQLNQLVGQQLVQIVGSFITLAFNIIFMFMLNPVLASVAMIAFPIYLLSTAVFRKVVTGAFKDVRRNISNVTSSIQEKIAGAKVVQAFGQEEKAASEFDQANYSNYLAGLKVRKIMSTFFPLIGFISSALTALVLYVGGLLSIDSIVVLGFAMTPGTLSAFNGFLAQFFQPFMTLMQFQQIIESAMAASDRIYGLLEEESDLPDPDEPAKLPDKGQIQFVDVSFGYKFDEPASSRNHVNGKKENVKMKLPRHGEGEKKPAMPGMPATMNPMEMMQRARALLETLPDAHKAFLKKNMMTLPRQVQIAFMTELVGTAPANIPSKIDEILARFGFSIPGSDMAKEHPELSNDVQQLHENAGKMQQPGNTAHPAGSAFTVPGSGSPAGMPPMDKGMLLMMAKNLASTLKPAMGGGTGGGMGGEGGGMGGGPGGGMKSAGGPSSMVRMLAMMDIPDDVFNEFPDVVKNAIKEEKVLLERETTTGYVLKGVNVDIPAGNTVAIVGETGAGKTTFIKLINRFYDVNDGRIELDGVDIRGYKKDDIRRLIGMVPQDSFLFVGSIKDNLLYGIDNVTTAMEQRMIEVSKLLGLHNFVQTLPDGYDTMLKENASNISIGQRQLIAFARALMIDPVVLILDEATSSVDPYTETLIQDALDKAREGRTTIIIAHRLSTIKNADKIYVIDKDKRGIIEEGTHDQLVKLNGRYKHLLDLQKTDTDHVS